MKFTWANGHRLCLEDWTMAMYMEAPGGWLIDFFDKAPIFCKDMSEDEVRLAMVAHATHLLRDALVGLVTDTLDELKNSTPFDQQLPLWDFLDGVREATRLAG